MGSQAPRGNVMPVSGHKRAQEVAALAEAVQPVRLKRHDALKILADERMPQLMDAINRFAGVTTYASAVRVVTTEPCYQLLCETCGWTLDMICPECPGCGCHSHECTGWRHREFAGDSSDDDDGYDYDGDYDEDDWYTGDDRDAQDGAFDDDVWDDEPSSPAQEEPDNLSPTDEADEGGAWSNSGPSSSPGSEEPPF